MYIEHEAKLLNNGTKRAISFCVPTDVFKNLMKEFAITKRKAIDATGHEVILYLISGFLLNNNIKDIKRFHFDYFKFTKKGKGLFILISNEKINKKIKDPYKKHIYLGLLLDYPKCCVEKYVDYLKNFNFYRKTTISAVNLKRHKKQCKKYGKDPYKFEPVYYKKRIRGYFSTLISHIPCSPECEETKKLVKRYKKALKR